MHNIFMSQTQILVVDDEPDIRQLVQEILEDEGYSVQVAKDGESARHVYAQQKPDLVLLDIWMPDIDGISLSEGMVVVGKPGCTGGDHVRPRHARNRGGSHPSRCLRFCPETIVTGQAAGDGTQGPGVQTAQPRYRIIQALGVPPMEPLGNSPVMQLLRNSAKQAANNTSPVMITGEAGSGRETLARYIHHLSSTSGEMVVLDHSQAGGENARSYLFGSVANGQATEGLLDKAAGGVLFIPKLQRLPANTLELLNNVVESNGYHTRGRHDPEAPGLPYHLQRRGKPGATGQGKTTARRPCIST